MPAFASSPAPEMTRWGKPVTTTQRLPGIWRVVTPSHGGFILSETRQAAMPEALRLDEPEYEHDVDWSLVIVAFQTEFAAAGDPLFDIELSLATSTVKCWRPERWEAYAGEAVEPRQSHVRREREAFEARIGQVVVTTAYGDWADWVPSGKVGVFGYRLGPSALLGHRYTVGLNVPAQAVFGSPDRRRERPECWGKRTLVREWLDAIGVTDVLLRFGFR